jgi:hypothetical protein
MLLPMAHDNPYDTAMSVLVAASPGYTLMPVNAPIAIVRSPQNMSPAISLRANGVE